MASASVAQLVEQRTCNAQVTGSNPVAGSSVVSWSPGSSRCVTSGHYGYGVTSPCTRLVSGTPATSFTGAFLVPLETAIEWCTMNKPRPAPRTNVVDQVRRPVRVLIVDDDPYLANTVLRDLVIRGFDAAITTDSTAVLPLMRDRPYDIIVTDMFMPNKSGKQLIADLKQQYPAVGIIAMSGYSLRELGDMKDVTAKLGADRFLPKPFRSGDLAAIIEELLPDQSATEEGGAAAKKPSSSNKDK